MVQKNGGMMEEIRSKSKTSRYNYVCTQSIFRRSTYLDHIYL